MIRHVINFVLKIGSKIKNSTAGSILFADSDGKLAQDNSNFFYDSTNKRVGVGTAAPAASIEVSAATPEIRITDTDNSGYSRVTVSDTSNQATRYNLVGEVNPFAGWGYYCLLTIQASKVSGDLSNFPVLLTQDNLPSAMFDSDSGAGALNGGGDIRFIDSSGNQLPCEVVSFVTDPDPANGTAEIWVKVPSISSLVNTDIYVYYNKAGETQPAPDSTYGSENVWNSTYKLISHDGGLTDSTSNSNDGNAQGGITSGGATGQIGAGTTYDGNNDNFEVNSLVSDVSSDTVGTISAWAKVLNNAVGKAIVCFGDTDANTFLTFRVDSSELLVAALRNAGTWQWATDTNVAVTTDSWIHLAVVQDGSEAILYVNGTAPAQGFFISTDKTVWISGISAGLDNARIGCENRDSDGDDLFFYGDLDEVRVSSTNLNSDWISAEFNNQDDPSTFVSPGTPTAAGSGSDTEVSIWSSQDGVAVGEKGVTTFGDDDVRTIINGQTVRFYLDGSETAYINTDGGWSMGGTPGSLAGGIALGDEDSGIYESADDTIKITTENTDRLTINSSGIVTSGDLTANGNMVIGSGAAGVDYTLTFNGETNDGILQWQEDEAYFYFNSIIRGVNTANGKEQLLLENTGVGYTQGTAVIRSFDDFRGAGVFFDTVEGASSQCWFAGKNYSTDSFQIGFYADNYEDMKLTANNPAAPANALFTITTAGDITIGKGAAGKDYSITVNGETNDGVVTWMEDEDYFDFADTVKFTGGTKSSDGSDGWTGSFTNGDGATVTVKNGLITDVS